MMAGVLRSLYQRLAGPKPCTQESLPLDRDGDDQSVSTFNSFLGPIEHHVVTIQCILIWEKPLASCLTLIVLNILFWVIVSFQYRFYFVLALGTALVYFYQTWVNQIWPEIRVPPTEGEDTEEWTPVNPQVLSVPEISRYLNQMIRTVQEWWTWLFDLRRSRPGQFCSLVTAILVVVALIGHYVTGVLVAYAILMTVMLGPGFMVHVYPHLKEFFTSDAFVGMCSPQMMDVYDDDEDEAKTNADGEDDFLPEPSEETLEVLNQALASAETDGEGFDEDASAELGLEAQLPNAAKDDSVQQESNDSFAFQAGLENLPSYDRDSDDDEFMDNLDAAKFPSVTQGESQIEFLPSHFDLRLSEDRVDSCVPVSLPSDVSVEEPAAASPALPSETHDPGFDEPSSSSSEEEADLTPTFAGCQRTIPPAVEYEPRSDDVSTEEVADAVATDDSLHESNAPPRPSEQLPSHQADDDLSDFEIVSESEYSS